MGKSFDTHAPIGPWITTSDAAGGPHALDLSCTVNGEGRQLSNTRHLVFNIRQQISHLSQAMTLERGDLIFTGTPGGIGAAMDPRVFLKPGDVVACAVEGLGAIEATMVAEARALTTGHDCDVLIIVGGPTGVTLGILLVQQGVRTIIAEKEPGIYPLPRAAHIDHEALRILQRAGVADADMATYRHTTRYDFLNAKGEILLRFDGSDRTGSGGWPGASGRSW